MKSQEGFVLDSSQDKTNWIGTFTPGTPATAAANALPAVNRWNNQDQLDRRNLMTRVTPLQLSGKIHKIQGIPVY